MILILGEVMEAVDDQAFTSYHSYRVCMGSSRKSAVALVAKEMRGVVVSTLSSLILIPD